MDIDLTRPVHRPDGAPPRQASLDMLRKLRIPQELDLTGLDEDKPEDSEEVDVRNSQGISPRWGCFSCSDSGYVADRRRGYASEVSGASVRTFFQPCDLKVGGGTHLWVGMGRGGGAQGGRKWGCGLGGGGGTTESARQKKKARPGRGGSAARKASPAHGPRLLFGGVRRRGSTRRSCSPSGAGWLSRIRSRLEHSAKGWRLTRTWRSACQWPTRSPVESGRCVTVRACVCELLGLACGPKSNQM